MQIKRLICPALSWWDQMGCRNWVIGLTGKYVKEEDEDSKTISMTERILSFRGHSLNFFIAPFRAAVWLFHTQQERGFRGQTTCLPKNGRDGQEVIENWMSDWMEPIFSGSSQNLRVGKRKRNKINNLGSCYSHHPLGKRRKVHWHTFGDRKKEKLMAAIKDLKDRLCKSYKYKFSSWKFNEWNRTLQSLLLLFFAALTDHCVASP